VSTLRIASSNCFWFQGRPFAPDRPGEPVPGILGPLAGLYRRLEPGLLCIQEVQSAAAFGAVSGAAGMAGSWCPGAELVQYGAAVLWSAGSAWRLAADSRRAAPPPQRVWQVVELPAAGGALRVANVHLPSSRQLSEETAERRRREEMGAVLTHGADIVLGDFNEQPGGPLGEFLAGRGYFDAAALTGRAHLGTTPKGRRGDQIWVAERLRERVAGYGAVPGAEMRSDLPGKDYLSDHFPVWVDLDMAGGAGRKGAGSGVGGHWG